MLVAPASLGDWIATMDDPGTAKEARASERHLLCKIAASGRRDNRAGNARDALSAAGKGAVTVLRWWSSSDRNGIRDGKGNAGLV